MRDRINPVKLLDRAVFWGVVIIAWVIILLAGIGAETVVGGWL